MEKQLNESSTSKDRRKKKLLIFVNSNHDNIFSMINLLNHARQAEVYLYTALVYFCNNNFKKAQKTLSQVIIKGKTFFSLPLFRTIRLVNLMVLYEIGDFDAIQYECRSIKREFSQKESSFRTENLMLKFVNKPLNIILQEHRTKLLKKFLPELEEIRHDIFEAQMLKIFDFTAWIESKISKKSLQNIFEEKF